MSKHPTENTRPPAAPDPAMDRRGFMKIVGVAGATAGALPLGAATVAAQTPAPAVAPASAPAAAPHAWLFLNDDEVSFINAAVDVLIPADSVGPGGVEAGVPVYIDRQLAGSFGKGDRLYLDGPFGQEPTPQQGYQLPLTPSELIRVGIADVNAYAAKAHGKSFLDLAPADRVTVMTELDKGTAKLDSLPTAPFFNMLLQLVNEGYFADPAYGGNKDKSVWKMIGFPGVGVVYTDLIKQYSNGKKYTADVKSIADIS